MGPYDLLIASHLLLTSTAHQLMNSLPLINAFWIGSKLGNLHAACLKSFVRHGHRVVLHTYDEGPTDTPSGVEIADASVLLSEDRIALHRNSGNLALVADLFRYELLAADAGVYIDCDCYCVKPLEDADYIFGRETDSRLCNAVLKLPPESPLLSEMRAIGQFTGFIPPWEKPLRKHMYKLRAALRRPVPLSKMKWGTAGPIALTYYANKFNLGQRAKPIDVFYPLHYQQVGLLRDPEIRLEDLITPRTKIVHLWNEFLRNNKQTPPPGSPLAKILASAHG